MRLCWVKNPKIASWGWVTYGTSFDVGYQQEMRKYYDICEGVLTDSENLLDGDIEAELYKSFSLKEETK